MLIGTAADGFASLTRDELPWGLFNIQLLLAVCCRLVQPELLLNYEKFVTVLPFIILIKINQRRIIII